MPSRPRRFRLSVDRCGPDRRDHIEAGHHAAVREPVVPIHLRGRRLSNALIGWHVFGDDRTPARLLLEVEGVGFLEAHTAGDGSLQLVLADPPQAFDMDQYGSFEFGRLPSGHPLAPLIGGAVDGVWRIVWRDIDVGLELASGPHHAVIANEADEVFVSDGPLPLDYADDARKLSPSMPSRAGVDTSPEKAFWTLLRRLDDPEHVERPANFDHQQAGDRFLALMGRLEAEFGGDVSADGWDSVQDASHFGRLVVPADLTESSARLVVTVSNFSPLASVALENPGVYDQVEFEALLEPDDRRRLDTALGSTGYVVVPDSLLWRPYDGEVEFLHGGSWWIRFFDHL